MMGKIRRLAERLAALKPVNLETVFLLDTGERLTIGENPVWWLLKNGIETPQGRIVSVDGEEGSPVKVIAEAMIETIANPIERDIPELDD